MKNSVNYKSLGYRIRLSRENRGYTQESLAMLIGISVSHMSNIETAKSKIGLISLVNISNILNVSIDYLITGKEPDHYQKLQDFFDSDKRVLKILFDIANVLKCHGIKE